MPEKVEIEFIGIPDDLLADSKKVQKEMDAISAKLKASGVSQSAYNKALQAHKEAANKSTEANQKSRMSFTEVSSAINLVQQGLQLAGQAYEATIGSTLKYANEVRQLSQISGESAENTSRFIQVLDDYKIGTDDALTATRALTKQGLSPSIDTLAKLSDQYRKLSSAEEKNAFIMKNLGKSGLQWVEVLNKGSAAILKQGDAVADGLILNQKQLDAARELEIAQDNLGESWQQISMTIGNKAIPAMTSAIDEFNNTSRAIEIMTESGMGWFEVLDNMAAMSPAYLDALKQANEETLAGRDAMLQNSEAVEENTASLEAQEAKVKAISDANRGFLGTLGQVSGAMTTYEEGIANADAALAAHDITAEEHAETITKLGADYQAAANQILLSLLEIKYTADGVFDDTELNKYLTAATKMGVITQEQRNQTISLYNEVENLDASLNGTSSQIYHTGERAADMADNFGIATAAAGDLTVAAYEAAGGVGAVKSQTLSMPASGTAWDYYFNIHVKGRVPSLPSNFDGMGGGMCFVRGTPVTLSDGTTKPIEQVEPGDKVRSYETDRGEFVAGVVVKIITRDVTEYLSVDGILVTAEHPFWIVDRGEWAKAGELKRGDILLRDNGGFQIVKNIFHIRSEVEVFNMTVEGVHNYFAGGVLVHNKAVGDDDMDTPHASGGVFMIPQRYGNEGFRLGNGDTASGGEKLAIAPQGKDFIDYDRMPRIDEKKLARAVVSALAQVDW
jgi:hypothetical protein